MISEIFNINTDAILNIAFLVLQIVVNSAGLLIGLVMLVKIL